MRLTEAYRGGRVSPQRELIAETADRLGRAFTVDELCGAVREKRGDIGVATVYRAVGALESSGWLARVGERDGSVLYARCVRDAHHHHLVCTGCGTVAHIECPLDADALNATADHGFEVTRHEIVLYGTCAACRASLQRAGDD